MEQDGAPRGNPGRISLRTAEIVTALVILILGLIVVFDSRRVGAAWGDDGPQAGYFPFYIGLMICIACAWILLHALFRSNSAESGTFATWDQLKPVFSMFVPSVVFVVAIYFLGLYVSAAIYIAAFMVWKGSFSIVTSALLSMTVSILLFLTFELWFLVPLPKGPVEALLGF